MRKERTLLLSFFVALFLFAGKEAIGQEDPNMLSIGPSNGSLLIMGGGPMTDQLWNTFIELMGGVDKHLVIIPTALLDAKMDEEYAEKTFEDFKKIFVEQGFSNISILHTRSKSEANAAEFTKVLETAAGVWFSGGRQWRFADSYLGTKTQEALNEVLLRGGVIAGGSAGATIQGSYLARGDTKSNTILMGDHEEGLGFIKNVAIDQHVLSRNRQNDMFEILDNIPTLLGIGIDEGTGIVVKKNRFTVVGESYVAIYDGTRWSQERDTIYQLPKGSREYYWLKAGDEYDLKQRKVVEFSDRSFLSFPKSQLKNYTGLYTFDGGSYQMEISVKKNTLMMHQKWNEYSYAIFPESDSKFVENNSNLFFKFNKSFDGSIISFSIPAQQSLWIKAID